MSSVAVLIPSGNWNIVVIENFQQWHWQNTDLSSSRQTLIHYRAALEFNTKLLSHQNYRKLINFTRAVECVDDDICCWQNTNETFSLDVMIWRINFACYWFRFNINDWLFRCIDPSVRLFVANKIRVGWKCWKISCLTFIMTNNQQNEWNKEWSCW